MKIPTLSILLLCGVATLATAQHNAKLTLADGSVIHGQIHVPALPVETLFGTVPVPLEKMLGIEFANAAKLSLVDGSILHGNIPVPAIPVETLFGAVPVPLEKVTRIEFVNAQKMVPANHDPRLIYWNTFDSKEDAQNPKAGVTTQLHGGAFVPGRVGNALHTQGKTDVASFTIPPGFVASKGCVEFWAKIDTDADVVAHVPGWTLRFLLGGINGRWSLFKLEFAANNGMGAGGFTASLPSSIYGTHRFGSSYSFKRVLGENYADWHHYALVWDDDEGLNIPGVQHRPRGALFINGKHASIQTVPDDPSGKTGMGRFYESGMDIIIAGLPTTLGITHPFAIDELKIWNYAKMDFDLGKIPVSPAVPAVPVTTTAPGWQGGW